MFKTLFWEDQNFRHKKFRDTASESPMAAGLA